LSGFARAARRVSVGPQARKVEVQKLNERQRIQYQKLVRDRIPQMIEADGKFAKIRILDEAEVVPALVSKLNEEAQELRVAEGEDQLEELADLHEVFSALRGALGFSEEDVCSAAMRKKTTHGGFDGRIWLEEVALVE
jgi:predicted house-cleaning noncanonical NTP pyrophosphatase (MazG superfamily)